MNDNQDNKAANNRRVAPSKRDYGDNPPKIVQSWEDVPRGSRIVETWLPTVEETRVKRKAEGQTLGPRLPPKPWPVTLADLDLEDGLAPSNSKESGDNGEDER